MRRYIDADVIYEKVENRYRISSGIEHRCERDLLDLICEAPTADVVEVVRCKDCIKNGLNTCPICYIEKQTLQFINHDPEFFCGYGEKER